MDKKLPIVLTLFHALLSGLSSYTAWPLKTFAGLEIESILLAIVAAAIGTILGHVRIVNRKLAPLMIACGIVFVIAIATYSFILSQPGATTFQLYFALFLIFVIFLIFFYVVTYLERVFIGHLQARRAAK